MNNQKVANREINKSYNYNPNLENYNHVQENDTTNEFSNISNNNYYNNNLNNQNNNLYNNINNQNNNFSIPCCCECHRNCCYFLCKCQNDLIEANKKLFDLSEEFKDLQNKYNNEKAIFEKIKNDNIENNQNKNDKLNDYIFKDDKVVTYLDMLQQFFNLLNILSEKIENSYDKIEDMNYYINKPFEFKNIIDKIINKINQINLQIPNNTYNYDSTIKMPQDKNFQSSFNIMNNVKNPFIQENEINHSLNNSNNSNLRNRKGKLYRAKSSSRIKSQPQNNIYKIGINDEELEKLRRINHINNPQNKFPQEIKDDIKNDLLNPLYKPIGAIQSSDLKNFNNKINQSNDILTYNKYNIDYNNQFENKIDDNSLNNNLNEENFNQGELNEEKFKNENEIRRNKFNENKNYDSYEENNEEFKEGNCWACNLGCSISQTGYSPMTYSPYRQGYKRREVTPIKEGTIYEEYTRRKNKKK